MREVVKELEINKGRIDSILRQYSRNARDFQLPCTATTSGGVPRSRSSVAPPMRKLCPVRVDSPFDCQTSLQRSRNQDLVSGDQPGEATVSNANNGA